MTGYKLSMSCVSGDEVSVWINRREDVFRWLKTLDHEGSNWEVRSQIIGDQSGRVFVDLNVTPEIEQEYPNALI